MEKKEEQLKLAKINSKIYKLNKTISDYDDEFEKLYLSKNKLDLDIELLRHEMDQIFNISLNETWIIDSNYIVRRVNEKESDPA